MPKAGITQRGVALIAVLWLVSAMGLIITGIVKSVRSEVRITGLNRQTLIANAQADATILLALQSLHARKAEPVSALQLIQVQFEGQTSKVLVQPLNGLIDINNAPTALLADMYHYAGKLPADAAQTIAQATITTRQIKNIKGAAQGFDSIEDLLQVPTMTYDLYAKINNLVTADLKEGSGRLNPMAAPLGVLQVLAGSDLSRAAAFLAKRNADTNTTDTSFFKPDLIQITPSRSLRIQASVELPDGGYSQKIWNVYWDTDPRSGLPWRVLSAQQSIQPRAQPEH